MAVVWLHPWTGSKWLQDQLALSGQDPASLLSHVLEIPETAGLPHPQPQPRSSTSSIRNPPRRPSHPPARLLGQLLLPSDLTLSSGNLHQPHRTAPGPFRGVSAAPGANLFQHPRLRARVPGKACFLLVSSYERQAQREQPVSTPLPYGSGP
ncbi:hypothetical protein CB1_000526029 [Camelus ferus]|nr:hypothetical protein CB1_000526029 [Camelus ferus]